MIGTLLRLSACLVILLTAADRSRGGTEAVPPATVPAAADPRTADALSVLRRVAEGKPLRLSTEGEQVPRGFHFVVRLSIEPKGGEPRYTDYVVVKDGDRVGVLVRALDGLPYCYMTDGLMVMVDHGEPGRLLLHPRGAPSVVYRLAEEEGKLDFWVSHVRRATRGVVDLNLAPVLKLAVGKLRQATFERSSGTLVGQTDRSAMMLTLPAAERQGDFGLRSYVSRSPGGQTLALLDPTSGGEPPIDVTRLTKDSITALAVPVREVPEVERGDVSLLVPEHFGVHPKERDASVKLLSLLTVSTVSASRPAK